MNLPATMRAMVVSGPGGPLKEGCRLWCLPDRSSYHRQGIEKGYAPPDPRARDTGYSGWARGRGDSSENSCIGRDSMVGSYLRKMQVLFDR